jgi:hypothetical protein
VIEVRPLEAVNERQGERGPSYRNARIDEIIGRSELLLVFRGMDDLRLHAVLGRENLKVLPEPVRCGRAGPELLLQPQQTLRKNRPNESLSKGGLALG